MALERELKFSASEDHVPSRVELDATFLGEPFDVARARSSSVFDIYLDDDARNLQRAGLALRLRVVEGDTVATLKSKGVSTGALHEREELELPAPGDVLPAPIHARVSEHAAPEALQVRVELRTERVVYPIEKGGDTVAYLSFDAVEARRPDGPWGAHFHEVEVEAVGSVGTEVLNAIAERVGAILALTANSSTKLERAEALLSLYGD